MLPAFANVGAVLEYVQLRVTVTTPLPGLVEAVILIVPVPVGRSITGILIVAPLVAVNVRVVRPADSVTVKALVPLEDTTYCTSFVRVPKLPSDPEITRMETGTTSTRELIVYLPYFPLAPDFTRY